MKFSIVRETLLKPLQVVSGVVERRHTLPVLANVLLQVKPDRLTLIGTDLEVELTADAPLEGAEEGELTVPARKFMDICRALPDEAKIDIHSDGERLLLRSGRSRFQLATLPANEFPVTNSVRAASDIVVPAAALRGLIEATQFCMANQDVRYYLNGMLFEVESGRLRTVATDGHRLAVSELEGEFGEQERRQIIIPRKGVQELSRLLGDDAEAIKLVLSSNHVRVDLGEIVMTSKLIDGRFPDYERVIPKDADKTVVADRVLLKEALGRTAILSNEKFRGVRIVLDENRLRANVHNAEQEEAEEEIEVEYSGPEFEIGFNVSYVVDALSAIKSERVELLLTDSNSSCLVVGVGQSASRYVVMPMRL